MLPPVAHEPRPPWKLIPEMPCRAAMSEKSSAHSAAANVSLTPGCPAHATEPASSMRSGRPWLAASRMSAAMSRASRRLTLRLRSPESDAEPPTGRAQRGAAEQLPEEDRWRPRVEVGLVADHHARERAAEDRVRGARLFGNRKRAHVAEVEPQQEPPARRAHQRCEVAEVR